MNYKQKYEEALERARKLATDLPNGRNDRLYHVWDLENIFPELRESEDEKIRKEIIDYIILYQDSLTTEEYNSWISWLEKQGKQKPEENKGNIGGISPNWSEEDEKMKNLIISTLTSVGTINLERYYHMNFDEVENWLKSLKDRVQPKSKQEWSKEDELTIERIVDTIEIARSLKNGKQKALYTNEILDGLIDWLKSLKPNHWKPSEEQMEALNAINNIGELSYAGQADLLIKLYNDLEKL